MRNLNTIECHAIGAAWGEDLWHSFKNAVSSTYKDAESFATSHPYTIAGGSGVFALGAVANQIGLKWSSITGAAGAGLFGIYELYRNWQ